MMVVIVRVGNWQLHPIELWVNCCLDHPTIDNHGGAVDSPSISYIPSVSSI